MCKVKNGSDMGYKVSVSNLFFIALFLVPSDMRYARKVKLAFNVSTISR